MLVEAKVNLDGLAVGEFADVDASNPDVQRFMRAGFIVPVVKPKMTDDEKPESRRSKPKAKE
jgi:hypothetical protein